MGSACAPSAPTDADYIAGRTTFRTCAQCHGTGGEGGAGPSFDSILDTFPTCAGQIEWVRRGSDRWLEEVGPTYGAQDTPVKGGMPTFEAALTATELRQIVFYERVRFGRLDLAVARSECGL